MHETEKPPANGVPAPERRLRLIRVTTTYEALVVVGAPETLSTARSIPWMKENEHPERAYLRHRGWVHESDAVEEVSSGVSFDIPDEALASIDFAVRFLKRDRPFGALVISKKYFSGRRPPKEADLSFTPMVMPSSRNQKLPKFYPPHTSRDWLMLYPALDKPTWVVCCLKGGAVSPKVFDHDEKRWVGGTPHPAQAYGLHLYRRTWPKGEWTLSDDWRTWWAENETIFDMAVLMRGT